MTSFHISLSPEQKQKDKEAVQELIMRADAGMDVFRRYLDTQGKTLKTGYAYLSPLRQEKHPSFNLFRSRQDGTIWFMDQASGGGNCLTFLMRLFGCDYRDAVRKLRSEVLGLSPDPDSIERLGNFCLGAPLVKRAPMPDYLKFLIPQPREHNFYQGPFADLDQAYYPEHIFGAQVLEAYHCQPLNSYRYQNTDPSAKHRDFVVGADWYIGRSMYGYGFGDGRQKIVQPNTPPDKNDRPRKWISTSKKELDLFGAHLLPAEGEPKLEAICLLAGNRDAMAFYRLTGVVGLASTAEGHLPTDEMFALMRRSAEQQFCLYDNDETGQKFQAVLTDDYQHPGYLKWLDNHREQAGRRFGFQRGLDTLLTHYGYNDLTELLQKTPVSQHGRLGTWFRQAMGLY